MSLREQTVVLLSRTTAFTVVCDACAEESPMLDAALVPRLRGDLRLEQDHGFVTCERGHRVRVIRAGRAVAAEPTTPLW